VRVVSGIVGSRMTRDNSSIKRARSVSSPTRCPPADAPASPPSVGCDVAECSGFCGSVEFVGRTTRRMPVDSRSSVSGSAGVPRGASDGVRATGAV
jgi:hypothetical protein